jgi:uncharacterized membrane protein (UPF0127 family)
MQDVRMPLVLVWIGADRRVIGLRRMTPCLDRGNDCPLYEPPRPFRFAIELLPSEVAASGLRRGARVALRPLG